MRECLAFGADPKAREVRGFSPLHKAAEKTDDAAVITALLDAGADPNALTNSRDAPLHNAASNNPDPAVITALIDAGADPMALGGEGNTPYELALLNESLEGTEELQRLKGVTATQVH